MQIVLQFNATARCWNSMNCGCSIFKYTFAALWKSAGTAVGNIEQQCRALVALVAVQSKVYSIVKYIVKYSKYNK